jgi:uncharacterized LabA/DUF88 family protein
MHRVRVYIDGFNLYYGMHTAFGRQYLWLDVEALARELLRPGQDLDRVSYFTAPVRGLTEGRHRQDSYLQALQVRSVCLDVVQGRFQEKTQRCRSCGVDRITYEEKETDVSIAVTLVEDAARSAYDTALVISGDSDLCPAIRAAKRLLPGQKIIAVFPPRRQSDPLRAAADGVLRIDRSMLRRAQLPMKVTTTDGVVLNRPDYWA